MERREAIEAAQAHIVGVLNGSVPQYGVTDHVTQEIINSMLDAQKELVQDIEYAKRELDHALPYLHGEPGRFNSLGILQSTGTRIDQNARTFSVLTGLAKSALVAYYEAKQ